MKYYNFAIELRNKKKNKKEIIRYVQNIFDEKWYN